MSVFKNKVVVITGAASGIGRSLAVQLAAKGARLAISDVAATGLEETRQLIGDGAMVKTYPLDVSSREAVFAHAEEVKKDFGSAHFIINNAGVGKVQLVKDMPIEEYEWLLGINLWGVIYGTKAFLPTMLEQREGCIVNISSVFGLLTVPCNSAYHISKYGVRGFTESLWRELKGTGVRAVVVHPGGIDTAIVASARERVDEAEMTAEERVMSDAAQKALTGSPDDCARQIIAGLEKGKKRILAGPGSKFLFFLSRWFPNSYGTVMEKIGY